MFDRIVGSMPAGWLGEVVQFTQARHAVLAGNLANINTPGYRTRDLSVSDFQERMRELLASRNEAPSPTSPYLDNPMDPTSRSHSTTNHDDLTKVRDTMRNLVYHDRTDIDLEKQVAEVSKNQYLHQLAISVMTSQFQLLNSVVSERV